MLLAIDCGNTNTVFAVFKDQDQTPMTWRCRTCAARMADEYISFLAPHLTRAGIAESDITQVIISSVVAGANDKLRRFIDQWLGLEARFVKSAACPVPIQIKMDRPEEVGADRLVNALAAKDSYNSPCIIIDFGTATTFDVVDAGGAYCGGVIAPGIHLSAEALSRAASALPKIDIAAPGKVIGTSTVTAMQSGLYWGYVAMIEGLIDRIVQEMGEAQAPVVIATGGLAALFLTGTDKIHHADPDLTLRGLKALMHLMTI